MNSDQNIKSVATLSALLLFLLIIPTILFGSNLPQASPVPGGIAVVHLNLHTIELSPTPKVFYKDNRVMTLLDDGAWYAVVGIPLNAEPGWHELVLRASEMNIEIPFEVIGKKYNAQRLTIKNKRKVDPNNVDLKRIRQERRIINASFSLWSDVNRVSTRFSLPLTGRLSSTFGLRRFYNNKPGKPHKGLDIAAPQGTAILAPADGKVIATEELFFTGKTVFIDHGQGLVTMYSHLDRIDVIRGQVLKKNYEIGTVGHTGRATGPHLHWSVSLNKTLVNPMLFTDRFSFREER